MSLADRVRTVQWLRPTIGAGAAGLVLLIAAGTMAMLSAQGGRLNTMASQATIGGAGLTLAGMVTSVALFVRAKLAGNVTQLTPSHRLARRVIDYEQQVKAALLSGLVAADLAYDANGHHRHRTPGRQARGASPNDEQVAEDLLRYRNSGLNASQNGGLTGIGKYYRQLRERGTSRLLILGQPGSGKTMLAIELILQLLREGLDASQPSGAGQKIPVRFSVAGWTTGTDLDDWLAERLTADYAIQPAEAQELIAGRKVLPVLDGLDEMDLALTDKPRTRSPGTPRAAAFLKALNNYADVGQPGPVVLTCRAKVYERLRETGNSLAACQEITILDLDTDQISDYFHRRYEHAAHPQRRNWDKVLTQLGKPEGAAARIILSTPWRLLLAITAAEGGKDPGQLLAAGVGETPKAAAERIDQVLLAEYIPAATRLTARRSRSGIRTKHYDADQVTRWMRHLALHLKWQDEQVKEAAEGPERQAGERGGQGGPPLGMSGVDLVPHLLWPIGGFQRVRAFHTVLQFLLSATGAVGMAYAIIGPPAVWLGNIRDVLAGAFSLPVSVAKAIGAICFVILVVLGTYRASRPWPSAMYSAPNRTAVSRRLPLGLGLGLGVGLGLGLGLGALDRLSVGSFRFGFMLGFTFGFVGGIWIMLSGEAWDPEADLADPHDGLRRELLAGFTLAFAAGLDLGIGIGLVRGPQFGVFAAFFLVLVTWLALVPVSIRYVTGVVCAALRRRLPVRLERFMEWSCDSGLLRVAGTAYQFRHRELQTWLTPSTAKSHIDVD